MVEYFNLIFHAFCLIELQHQINPFEFYYIDWSWFAFVYQVPTNQYMLLIPLMLGECYKWTLSPMAKNLH